MKSKHFRSVYTGIITHNDDLWVFGAQQIMETFIHTIFTVAVFSTLAAIIRLLAQEFNLKHRVLKTTSQIFVTI